MKKYSSDWYWYYVINYALVVIILFPIYWTFISSVKVPEELITNNPTFYPHNWTWEYYDTTWNFNDEMRTKLQKEISDVLFPSTYLVDFIISFEAEVKRVGLFKHFPYIRLLCGRMCKRH